MNEAMLVSPALSNAEHERLSSSRALVAGCGGLGCYAVELLARVGVGALRVVDGDVFERGNLDRQLYSDAARIGRSKVAVAAERAAALGLGTAVEAVNAFIDEGNALELVSGCDIALDALDSVPARLILAQACASAGIPLVHAAVSGWRAQAAFVPPGSGIMERIYTQGVDADNSGTLSFMPSLAASVQACEAVKALAGRKPSLAGRLLLIDLLTGDFHTVEL